MKGYFWQGHGRSLMLPHGTTLAMKYGKVWQSATVEDGRVLWQGKATTPSAFANDAAGGTNRNAWNELRVTFPGASAPVRARDAVSPPPPGPSTLGGSCDPQEWATACGHPDLAHWFACAMLNAVMANR